ncbi:MAG: hypothetical protein RSC28_06375 [Bacteroidales bacterium]
MRKIFTYLFSVTIVVVYLISTMGYGVHECNHDGTKDVIVLFGETPCEYVHSHIDKDGHVYTHAHNPKNHKASEKHVHCSCKECAVADSYVHSDNCCHTTVYGVTYDQTLEDNVDISVPFIYIDFAVQPAILSCSLFQSVVTIALRIPHKIPNNKGDLYISNNTLRV